MKKLHSAARGAISISAVALVLCLCIAAPSKANVQTFADVPTNYWAYSFIRTFAANGISGGCGGGNFCPGTPVNRAQMAVFLERGIRGRAYSPPPPSGTVFADVGVADFAAAFIEQLAADGVTGGCGGGNYCPNAPVTRAQMAVFLLRAIYGSGYSPPPATGSFGDVPPGSFAAAWIEALAAEGISGGCGGGNFCPNDPVTRAQMAVFMVRAFDLVFSNGAPTVEGGSYTTSDAAALEATLAGTDPEGDPITFAVATEPMKGTVTSFDPATGAFLYEPSPGQDGLDSFTVTASDRYQVSATATVNIEIFAWLGTRQFGTPFYDYSTTSGLFFDSSGNLVLGGSTAGQLGSTTSAGQEDAWIRKVDRRGNDLWTVQAGNANSNNARIVARVPGTDNIVSILTDDDADTASIVKFDSAGNTVLDVPVDFRTQSTLQVGTYWGNVDADGDVYILSWRTSASSLLTKVNGLSGATEWQVPFDGTFDNAVTPFDSDWLNIRLRSVDFDATGNVVVAGFYTPDSGAAPRNCQVCSFIGSFDGDGNLLWVTETDLFAKECTTDPASSAEAVMYRLMVAPDGTLWATGSGTTTFNANGVGFSQVSKFSADGTQLLWTDCNNGPVSDTEVYSFSPTRFAADGDGLVLSYDWDTRDPVTNPSGSGTLTLSRLTPAGALEFRRTLTLTRADGTPARVNAGDIVEDSQGLLYISGSTDGEFLPGGALGDFDAFVLRLDADGLPTN